MGRESAERATQVTLETLAERICPELTTTTSNSTPRRRRKAARYRRALAAVESIEVDTQLVH